MKERLKILILEDNYRLLAVWKKVLEDAGHEVITAYNPTSALRLTEHHFDCFIIDLHQVQNQEFLPDGGLRIINMIKNEFSNSQDPLMIAVTGHISDRSDVLDISKVIRNMGVTKILRKPLHPVSFLDCIDQKYQERELELIQI